MQTTPTGETRLSTPNAFGRRIITLLLLLAAAGAATTARAAVGQPVTAGPNYDRNPSVVQDGALTYLFFARSQSPCNRLLGCNPDAEQYDLYYKASPNGGKDWGPDTLIAVNPDGVGPFYGRTIAATRVASGPSAGTLYVFWATGGNETTLYYVSKAPNAPAFTAATPVLYNGLPLQAFNVEAVASGADVYMYTEECCNAPKPPGIYAYAFNAGVATVGNLVAANKNIPKAIVDVNGGFRMTMTDASAYPTVDVYVDSSPDGLNWAAPEVLVIHEPGVSHWDPQLTQKPNGQYYLYSAPDFEQGAGRQRVALTKSNDFINWSATHEQTPGYKGGVAYWDYWPEGFMLRNQEILFYTSERGYNRSPEGTGHIWVDPGKGGSF